MHDYSRNDNKRRGIVMMLLACLFFSLMDAVMKRLAADFPAIQVTALRAMSSLPLILLVALGLIWKIRKLERDQPPEGG